MQAGAEYLTIREVAGLLRVSVRTVRNWMTTGELPQPITIGRRRLFRRAVLDRCLAEREKGQGSAPVAARRV